MIELKGMDASVIRCVIPDHLCENELFESLHNVNSRGKNLLPKARVVLDFQGRPLPLPLVFRIMSEFVDPSGVEVLSWVTYDSSSLDQLKRMGFPLGEPNLAPREKKSRQALFLKRSLRSGQRAEHAGDIILCGHVNEGAEVLSTGHIIVLGRLHGVAHAGMDGDESVSVITKSLGALHVRIGRRVGVLDRHVSAWGKPAIMTVENESVLISEWPA